MNNIQESACRAIDVYRWFPEKYVRPMFILTEEEHVSEIRRMVSISLSLETPSVGSAWRLDDGRVIAVHPFSDTPPKIAGGFELAIVTGGDAFTAEDIELLKGWRDAAGE